MTAALLVPAVAAEAANPAGTIDLSFGSCGVRQASSRDAAGDPSGGSASAVAIQPDGKIVLAGVTDFPSRILLIRLLPDGRWDHSFGHAGSTVTYLGGAGGPSIRAVALQADGRIVVGGSTTPWGGGQTAVLLARYLGNGALDPTFGTGGTVTHHLGSHLSGLALQPDGKLVGVGERVFRLLANGAPDPAFGINGVAPTGHGVDVAVQPDGKIVVPFGTDSGPPAGKDYTLLRLLPNGTVDPSFQSAPVDLAGGHDTVSDLVLAGDGRIISAGVATAGGPWTIGVTRHLPDGSPDLTFGDQGRAVVPGLSPETWGSVRAGLQDDDKVVVAYTDHTSSVYPDVSSFALVRLTSGGALDETFGNNGVTSTPVADRDGTVGGLARQSSGDWVVGGYVRPHFGSPTPAAVRYHGGGTSASPGITAETCRRDADLTTLSGWNYGDVGIGRRSVTRTFVLTNTGTASVRPTKAALARPGANQFQIVGDSCTGAIVVPSAACAVSVRFIPTIAQASTAELVMWDDAGWGFQSIGLQGEGFAALNPASWGGNNFGQLGAIGGRIPLPNAVSTAAGYYHNVALRSDGTVWAWGWNGMGQLGDGTNINRSTPVKVTGLTDVVAVGAGAYHSFAIRSDGSLWAWGWNYFGQLGDGSTVDRWSPARVNGIPPVTAVSGGWVHSMAVGYDGFVRTWGWNGVGHLGDGSNIDRHLPVLVAGLGRIQSVAAGVAHSLALRTDGSLFAWGWNAFGQLGDGSVVDRQHPVAVAGVTDAVQVAAGGYHSLVIRSDRRPWTWGWNGFGQLGDGTSASRATPGPVPGFVWTRAISGGFVHSLAVENDRTVRAWGWNWAGQLGDGTTDTRLSPVPVYGVERARQVSAGALHSLSG